MGNTFRIATLARALCGAAIGGIVGYFAFAWFYNQGFYAMVLPGAALGIGCGAFVRGRFPALGIACGIAAVGLGLFTEWKFFPFIKDDGLMYFLTHVHELKPVSLLMIGLGGVIAYYYGAGRTTVSPTPATMPAQPTDLPVERGS